MKVEDHFGSTDYWIVHWFRRLETPPTWPKTAPLEERLIVYKCLSLELTTGCYSNFRSSMSIIIAHYHIIRLFNVVLYVPSTCPSYNRSRCCWVGSRCPPWESASMRTRSFLRWRYRAVPCRTGTSPATARPEPSRRPGASVHPVSVVTDRLHPFYSGFDDAYHRWAHWGAAAAGEIS